MNVSKWVGKKVKCTRNPPNSHIVFYGVLKKTWTGHYEIDTNDGGQAMVCKGDTMEYNGKCITVDY